MLDFNEAEPAPLATGFDRDAVRNDLLARLESVLLDLFPAGKKRRRKFLIGDTLGSPGDSLEVVLDGDKAGLWTDRATGAGGDIFDLIATRSGLDVQADFTGVLQRAAEIMGRAPLTPARRRRSSPPIDDLGPATAKWDYLDASGQLLAVVYRYDPPGRRKEFRPWDARRRKMAPPRAAPAVPPAWLDRRRASDPGRGREMCPGLDRCRLSRPPPPCMAPMPRSRRSTGRRSPASRC